MDIVTYLPREGPGINDDGINSYISYFCKEIARFEVFRNSIEPQTRMFEGELALPIHLARGRKLTQLLVAILAVTSLCISTYLPREGTETR